jgi:hypothetical protein
VEFAGGSANAEETEREQKSASVSAYFWQNADDDCKNLCGRDDERDEDEARNEHLELDVRVEAGTTCRAPTGRRRVDCVEMCGLVIEASSVVLSLNVADWDIAFTQSAHTPN